jgi:hypothetical protein
MYGVEVVDLKCAGRGQKHRHDKKRGYSYIKLPGPNVVKRLWGVKVREPEDWSWLNSFLTGIHSRVGDLIGWKVAAAANLTYCLQNVEKIVESYGRSVWFYACPLEGKKGSIGSSFAVGCSHWSILVSRLTRCQMIARIESGPPIGGKQMVYGELHELREYKGQAYYYSRPFRGRDFGRRGRVIEYLGQTDSTDDDLDEFGIYLTTFENQLLTN